MYSSSDLASAHADVYALLEERGHSAWAYSRLGFTLEPLLSVAEDWIGESLTDRYAFVAASLLGVRLRRPPHPVDAAAVAPSVAAETAAPTKRPP